MPIFDDKTPAPVPAPVVPAVVPKPYYGAAVDTRYTPMASLITYLAGAAWTVTYYSQVIDYDNEVGPQQVQRQAAYQQYRKINRMELKVTTPLTSTQDQTNTMVVTGGATIYPGIIPNVGDVFVADSGDGKPAIFTVTASHKMSIFKDAAYTIEYQLTSYYTGTRASDLENKVVQNLYFVKDYQLQDRNPYLIEEEYQRLGDFAHLYRRLLSDYIGSFTSYEQRTLLVPDQASITYDPFITAKVLNWFSPEDCPTLMQIKPLNIGGDVTMRMKTVLDAIEQMDQYLLPISVQKMALVNSSNFKDRPELRSIFYTSVCEVVFPLDNRTDVDQTYQVKQARATLTLREGRQRWWDLSRTLTNVELDSSIYSSAADGVLPDIHPVTATGDYYIFSEAFYRGTGTMLSKFEVMVRGALAGNALDTTTLQTLAMNAHRWDNLERYYFIPILLALLKCAIIRGS